MPALFLFPPKRSSGRSSFGFMLQPAMVNIVYIHYTTSYAKMQGFFEIFLFFSTQKSKFPAELPGFFPGRKKSAFSPFFPLLRPLCPLTFLPLSNHKIWIFTFSSLVVVSEWCIYILCFTCFIKLPVVPVFLFLSFFRRFLPVISALFCLSVSANCGRRPIATCFFAGSPGRISCFPRPSDFLHAGTPDAYKKTAA